MSLTTMDRMRAIVAGTAPLAPVASTFGMALVDVEPGRATGRMRPLPPSTLRGAGPLLVLADMALSIAVASTLDEDLHVSTLTMHAAGLAVPRAGAGHTAVGRVEHRGSDFAVASAVVTDDLGTPVALLTSRSAMFTARVTPRGPGAGLPALADPVAALGVTTAVDGDETVVAMRARAPFANSGGSVQGGVLSAVAAHAIDTAIGAARPHLADAPTDLDITFVRGVRADGATAEARAALVHAGSRFASARAELRDAAGKLAIVVTGSRWRG